ncbi:MAG: dihydrolipoyl dehydrogenase [Thermoleophilia bacterium]|nr:dihydrolipoyl dehydrogenase [Thermoleophilia bacterium]
MECDVLVLGGGPAGYTAAIRAAQLGGKVVCVEREPALGGTCLRVGCIPTKAWVQSAHALHDARERFASLGVRVGEAELDFGAVSAWKDGVVKQMTGGIASLFKANGVEWVQGEGRFTSPHTLQVAGGEEIRFGSAIVATGSAPVRPPIPGLDSGRCVDSTGLLAIAEVPRRLAILGGGIIGCEFASIFGRFGSEVTIIELLPTLIPAEDADAAKELEKAFRKRGIVAHLGKQCTAVEESPDGLVVHFGEGESIEVDLMLVAVGRAAVVDGLGLEAAGVMVEAKRIPTDAHRRTNVPHIYAAGDVAGFWQLAHTGFREGEVAAENALGHDATIDSPAVPRPIYTDPEIAGVGLTEAQARERYGDERIAVGRCPWAAVARAVMAGDTTGWVKTIHETTYGELLGVVIVGPHATDLIGEAVVAIDTESTVETIANGIAPHPTFAEALKEAGLVALDRAIHLPPRRKR